MYTYIYIRYRYRFFLWTLSFLKIWIHFLIPDVHLCNTSYYVGFESCSYDTYAVCSVLEKRWKYCERGFLTGRMGTHPHTRLLSKHDQLGYPENKVTQSPNVLLQKQNILPCWLKKRKHTHNQIKHQSLIQNPQRIAFALNQDSHVDAFPAPMFSNHLCFQSWDQSQ